jgi:uncharacterized oligopeptide transporter (OPT) family protein
MKGETKGGFNLVGDVRGSILGAPHPVAAFHGMVSMWSVYTVPSELASWMLPTKPATYEGMTEYESVGSWFLAGTRLLLNLQTMRLQSLVSLVSPA